MTIAKQKEILHKKIDGINDPEILENINYNIDNPTFIITHELKAELDESLKQIETGDYISSEEMDKIMGVQSEDNLD